MAKSPSCCYGASAETQRRCPARSRSHRNAEENDTLRQLPKAGDLFRSHSLLLLLRSTMFLACFSIELTYSQFDRMVPAIVDQGDSIPSKRLAITGEAALA